MTENTSNLTLTKTRTKKAQADYSRQKLARTAKVGGFVALQSADDEDNLWWLAQVTSVAFKCIGRDGVAPTGWR